MKKLSNNFKQEFVLTLSCPDAVGIVFGVSSLLYRNNCNILDSNQFGDIYGDDATGHFFMRVHFEAPENIAHENELLSIFEPLFAQFNMKASFHAVDKRSKVLLMVSKHGHCLNDLLFRWKSGQLKVDIPAIVSNHPDFEELASSYAIPFYYLPITNSIQNNKRQQELQIEAIIKNLNIDLIVLARYMQVLSPEFCQMLSGKAINIHHSFLPSFKGAKPYYQAHSRGVKIIGATAHYVTSDLDEGPIIEQDVERVDHSLSAEDLSALGRDVECIVLARAVKWHIEHRVMLNGNKTLVFR